MNAIATIGHNIGANYTATMDHARILGNNMRTERNRVRQLARTFVLSAVDENYQLEALIEDAREAMGWGKLDKAEKNRANVLFSTLRTIVGAWDKLPTEVQDAFRAGKKIYSTLADEIKEARKAREEAEAAKDAEDATPAEEPAQEPAPAQAPAGDPVVDAMRAVALFVDETPLAKMSGDQLLALKNLVDAIDEFRAANAKPAQVSKAA